MAEPQDGTQTQDGEGGQNAGMDELEALKAERDALLAKRDELLTETKKVKDRLRAFDGVDPEEFKTLKQRLAEIETQKKAEKAGITSQELEKMRAEVRQALEGEFAPFRERAEALEKENRALKLDNVVKQAMAKSGVKADRIDALFRLNSDAFDLTDDGKPMVRESPGVEVEKYIGETLLKAYPEWFEGSGSSGGGASKSAAGGGRTVTRVVAGADNDAFVNNLEGIAKGTVEVR